MVAQNELGPNAPAEAYKAQCVATHCSIISQSGYPSVLGAEPGAAALAAAQEVAHVLVTYNGQVCFAPGLCVGQHRHGLCCRGLGQ